MVELLGLGGLAAFVAASLVVGGRIFALALRTRGLPETTMGGSLILAGGVGTGLAIVPRLLPSLSPEVTWGLQQAASAAGHVGYALMFVFVWRVFRPSETWAAWLFGISLVTLIAGGVGSALALQPGGRLLGAAAAGGFWLWASITARFVVYLWATTESFAYYAKLRRRLKLGLADEGVAARFLCWGICTSAVVGIWINLSAQRLLAAASPIQPWITVATALLGFVVAGSLWLAFFPKGREGARSPA